MRIRYLLYFIIVSAILVLIAITVSILSKGRVAEPIVESNDLTTSATYKGISVSPKSFTVNDYLNFYTLAQDVGDTVAWSGDWSELGKSNGAPYSISQTATQYGLTRVMIVQFFNQDSKMLLRPLSEANLEQYTRELVQFTQAEKPEYLGIGIEVNILYEADNENFMKFVALYNQVYPEVKTVSPNTKVFTIFQLERMKGLKGGLFGGVNNEKQSDFEILGQFENLDLLAFTTYPGLIYKHPGDIPNDYYTSLIELSDQPIAYTEIGWFSTDVIQGWESSEVEQAEFIQRFGELNKEVKPGLKIWSFLYDPDIEEPFRSMGLINSKTDKKKLGYSTWKEL